MRSTLSLLPAALLVVTFAGCTQDDTPPASSSTPPTNHDRATTGGQPVHHTTTPAPHVNDSRDPARDTETARDVDAMNRSGTTKTKDTTVKAQDQNTTYTPTPTDHNRDTINDRNRDTVNDRNRDTINDRNRDTVNDRNRDTTTGLNDDVDRVPASDNTGTNTRDRDSARLTPFDQGSSESDIEITQTIRQAVVDGDELSINAQNVKIITKGGVVTLRGPVATAAERAAIETIAQRTTGVHRVDNQLEITNP